MIAAVVPSLRDQSRHNILSFIMERWVKFIYLRMFIQEDEDDKDNNEELHAQANVFVS